MACRQFIVTGRVQGVFFRASTRDAAKAFGLNGWARNMPDGSVEVLACGTSEQLDRLQAWLHQGPPLADVEQVQSRATETEDEQIGADFTIR